MRLLTVVVVVSNVLGNLLLSIGIKTPNALLIAAGIALLMLWTLSRMALMSWADLSYVLPLTSIGYVLTALAGKYVLAEQISLARWSGTLLIIAGILIVSQTPRRTQA
jgi:uncharacterized membrane protein